MLTIPDPASNTLPPNSPSSFGVLEWLPNAGPDGTGRLRHIDVTSWSDESSDPVVPGSLVRRFNLRQAVEVEVSFSNPAPPASGLPHVPQAVAPSAESGTISPAAPSSSSADGPVPSPAPRDAQSAAGVASSPAQPTLRLPPRTFHGGRVQRRTSALPPSYPAAAGTQTLPPPARQGNPPAPAPPASPRPTQSTGPAAVPARTQPLPRPPVRPQLSLRPTARQIVRVEGLDPEVWSKTKVLEDLTALDPEPRLALEYPGCPVSCRLIDLFCPIGRGQRALIVSPPKAGKTTLLKDIAGSIARNHPDVYLFALLIDERPEEVTDFRRTFERLNPAYRVLASSNDQDTPEHVSVSTMTIERCKRMAEAGKHVVVLLDSLTRLGRAFNRSSRHATSGRTMTGGLDSRALEVPKQIFGAARNTQEAGSLTIIASCLVDTGSAADQIIFEEFKGTGNMELVLDRKISERRLFPAINLAASGTRKEHLLMSEQEVKTMTALRRRLLSTPPHVQVEQLLAALNRFPTNAALVGSAAGA